MAIKKTIARSVGNPSTATRDTHGSAQALVINYWGSLPNEKYFLMNIWQAKALLAASPLAKIAVKVTNATSPANVAAEWLPLTTALETNINNPAFEPTVHYFIITKPEFETMAVGGSVSDRILTARIGKKTSGEIVLFINLAKISFIIAAGPAGPTGAGAGIKIPPQ